MAQNVYAAVTDLAQGVQMHRLGRLFAQNDKLAHRFDITVKENGAAANLSGYSASAFFIRADDGVLTFAGTVSGNVVSVSLPNACYEVPGHFSVIVKVSNVDTTTAVFWGDGTVTRSETDVVVDPTHIVPDLAALLAQIEAMQTGTAAANEAASAASSAASSATSAATSANSAAVKINDMTVGGHSVLPGAGGSATLTLVNGHYNIEFGIEQGATGAAGRDGVIADLGADEYSFNIDSSGHLILTYSGGTAPNFAIDSNGHLIHTW